jgi:hypothetical protein
MTSRNAREGHYGGMSVVYATISNPKNNAKKWERVTLLWKHHQRVDKEHSLRGAKVEQK